MGNFEDLLFQSHHPGIAQKNTRQEFPQIVAKSNLHLWNIGDEIVTDRKRFLIGVATWLIYDMRLLDALNDALYIKKTNERVDVFDIDTCQTIGEISAYIPNLGKIQHPPVVGVWQNRQQIEQASGPLGRNILIDAFGLNHDEITALGFSKP